MKARTSRAAIYLWAVSILLSTLYVHTGTKKIIPNQRRNGELTVQHFRDRGYSDEFRVFIGYAEIAGAAGLLCPPVASLAAVGLAPIMLGAVYAHIFQDGEPAMAAVPVLAMLLLTYVGTQRQSDLFRFGLPSRLPVGSAGEN